MKKMNKKIAGGVLAGAIALGSLTGGAYAYKDEWTAKIQQGIHYLAVNVIFKGEIEASVDAEGEKVEKQMEKDAQTLISKVYNELESFKKAETARGVEAVQEKYRTDKANIESVAEKATEKEKNDQRVKTNTAINQAGAEMDAIVEKYLNQIPKK